VEAVCTGKDFLNRIQAAELLREWMDKWDYVKLKSFCTKQKKFFFSHRVGENIC
jgi:hypothetical protein